MVVVVLRNDYPKYIFLGFVFLAKWSFEHLQADTSCVPCDLGAYMIITLPGKEELGLPLLGLNFMGKVEMLSLPSFYLLLTHLDLIVADLKKKNLGL